MLVRSSNWSHDGRPRNAGPVASMRAHGLVIVPDDADGVDGAALDDGASPGWSPPASTTTDVRSSSRSKVPGAEAAVAGAGASVPVDNDPARHLRASLAGTPDGCLPLSTRQLPVARVAVGGRGRPACVGLDGPAVPG